MKHNRAGLQTVLPWPVCRASLSVCFAEQALPDEVSSTWLQSGMPSGCVPYRVWMPCSLHCLLLGRSRAILSCCRAVPVSHSPCHGALPRIRSKTNCPLIAILPCSHGSPARCSIHAPVVLSSNPVSVPIARLPAAPAGVCHGRC